MEQKYTPGLQCTLTDSELIEKSQEWISKLAKSGGKEWCLSVPVDFNRDPDMLFSELCNRIAELSKENETLTHNLELEMKANQEKEKALTEQVEKLKEINTDLEETNAKLVVAINPREAELSRLREERKELVEALRELYKCQPTMLTLIPDAALDFLDLPKKATLLKVESLLSKFEVPNQS